MIPQEHGAAVARGLQQAFDTTQFEVIRELTGGPMANLAYRVAVRGAPFLLRINTRRGDVARQYACMNAAAAAGLAPRVWYTSVEDRVSITDFVQTAPFPAPDALLRIPAALRKLHALPAFDGVPDAINTSCMFLMNPGPARDGFFEKFRTSNLLRQAAMEEFFARHAQLAAAHGHRDMASSHNDLFKPDNMLFDGQRLWLVDWEAAFLNDRYADLAVVANMIVTNDAEEHAFLREYFGAEPTAYQLARLFLMQQLAHLFYTMGFLFMGSQGQPVDWSAPVPDYFAFHRRFWSGEIKLTDNPTKILYARLHWERLMHNVKQPRYAESLSIVVADSS